MRIGTLKLSSLVLLCFLLFINACAQNAEEKLKLSYQHEDKALELRKKGDIQGAIKEQLKAIELNSNDSKPLTVLAGMYMDIKQWEMAETTLEKALKIDGTDSVAHHLYSNIAQRLNKNEIAVKQAEQAVKYDPKNLMYWTNLGVIYGSLENRKSEREAYQKALEIDSNYLPALYNLALLESEEGNTDKAITLLKQVIEKSSDDEERLQRAQDKLRELENKIR